MAEVKPYGDSTNDGLMQVSFTLPVPASDRARASALELARKMGLEPAQVTHMKAVGPDFSYFVVYGSLTHAVDPDSVTVVERDFPLLDHDEVNEMIRTQLKRRLVVVGAATGTDAHTVGLDAILSMKGVAGDHGLEYFPEIRVVNMGSQVQPAGIVDQVVANAADAVLVSQVVTQRNAHVGHLTAVREALETAGVRDRIILVGGGPRFSPEQAAELGYDRIFGPGTKPSEVASYLAWAATKMPSGY